jgi:hypothetical protein
MYRPHRLPCALLTLFGLLLLTSRSFAEVAIGSADNPLWLFEQPVSGSPLLTARLAGTASVGAFTTNATLMLSCHPQYPGLSLGLQISAEQLGFAVAPFEGPDATASGPISVHSGARATQQYPVSGAYRDAGSFQVGTIFEFLFSPSPAETRYWSSDAARGQIIQLNLAAAQNGQPALSARFQLPHDNADMRSVLSPCLSASAP